MAPVHPADCYTYRAHWSAEDEEYVGTCAELPSLSHLDGSLVAALEGIRRLVAEVMDAMHAAGETPPSPFATRQYSGEFKVRIPPHLHRRLATEAAEEGVSLNRLVSARLAHD